MPDTRGLPQATQIFLSTYHKFRIDSRYTKSLSGHVIRGKSSLRRCLAVEVPDETSEKLVPVGAPCPDVPPESPACHDGIIKKSQQPLYDRGAIIEGRP